MIRETTAKQTDAVYLLVQCAMVLEYALQAAHAEWGKIRGELNQLRSTSSGSFLANPNAWGKMLVARPHLGLARAPANEVTDYTMHRVPPP